MIDLIEVALYMREAHLSHSPRMGGEPYECHPWHVMAIYVELFGKPSPEVAAAILLHDVDEDHRDEGYTLKDIAAKFGQPVADLVSWVTKPERPASEEKEAFNRRQYERLGREGPDDAVRMKVADRMANLSDSSSWGESFRTRYIADTLNLIMALRGRPGVEHVERRLDVIRG